MFDRFEVGYVTKRGAQLQLIGAEREALVFVDLVKNESGVTTGFKPKTKVAAELEFLEANKDAVTAAVSK